MGVRMEQEEVGGCRDGAGGGRWGLRLDIRYACHHTPYMYIMEHFYYLTLCNDMLTHDLGISIIQPYN